MRVALGVEYDGGAYSGWERQTGRSTVQGAVEAALSRIADESIRTVCAGRTDSGVHACGQVVHFDTGAERDDRAWVMGVNSTMASDVAVRWVRRPGERFHARFGARCRHYRYVIFNHASRSALLRHRSALVHRNLDQDRMQAAGDYLLGEHDFSAYRASSCQARSPVRTILRLEVRRCARLVCIDVSANAFLHHMVRNIAGVLIAVGTGDWPPQRAREVLESRDRRCGGVTAAPGGLYLLGVDYPQAFGIPSLSPSDPLW